MDKITELNNQIQNADAILIGSGSGISNAAGMDFWYEASPTFLKYFKYFYDKYHFKGAFQGYYNHFDSEEERWAFIAILTYVVAKVPPQKPTYKYLQNIIGNKPVHFITTNQDGILKKYFDEKKVSEIQGSWDFLQSTHPEKDRHLYPANPIYQKMLFDMNDHKVPRKDFPVSKIDGSPLIPWVRGPQFLEGKKYNEEYQKINSFLAQHRNQKLLFLEMGVGRMTPMFIQGPFWELTNYMKDSFYININPQITVNPAISNRSLLIADDINKVLKEAAAQLTEEKND